MRCASRRRVQGVSKQDQYSDEEVEKELVFLGYVGMMDPPREEAVEAVKVCRQVSIRPVMITGDHKLTAVAVAKEVGIFREGDKPLPARSSPGWTRRRSPPSSNR